jgi:DNA repair exonuclease SbcCD ATPase subunit
MLESLTLENFQAHKKLVVEFDKGITVIVGPTDSGKSSIIRALGWVAFNRPGGDQFIRYGAKAAVVTMCVDGQIIVRSRGRSENLYFLNGDEFKAFGNDVPTGVKDLLKMQEINFQGQHDSPFWFSETAGEVSRQLNQIVNLGVIDHVLGFVAARVRSTRETATIKGERVEELKKKVEELKPVVQIDKDLRELEELHEHLNDKVIRCRRLASLVSLVESKRETVEIAEEVVQAGTALLLMADRARTASNRVARLNELGRTVSSLNKRVGVEVPDLRGLEQALDEAKEARAAVVRLSTLISSVTAWRDQLEEARRATTKAEEQFHNRIKGERCPLCGNHLK